MHSNAKKETVVMGLGNPLMGDEGIGVHIISALQEVPAVSEIADIVDLGTSPLTVIHAIAGYRKAVIVDCARMMKEPGDVCRFTPKEVVSLRSLEGFSLHECELFRALEISAKLEEHPREVVIIGIEPERFGLHEGLSARLARNLEAYVQRVLEEIEGEDLSFPLNGGSHVYGVAVSGD
jgi:hydrogenase maturation protease